MGTRQISVTVECFVEKDGKWLMLRRHLGKRILPDVWIGPGGHQEFCEGRMTGAIRGRAALVETDEPFCISQAVAVVRFGGLTAYEPFLLRVVQSRFTQRLIEEESMGTAIPHISITNLSSVRASKEKARNVAL